MDVQRIAPLRGLLGCTTRAESGSGRIGPISLGAKQAGERSAGNPHAAFDAAEAGNVARSRWCDTRRRKSEPTGNTNFDLNRRASPRPYRAIQTGIGPVEVQKPKARDRAASGERIRFSSNILPKWARRTKSLDALLPVLYSRGISARDFQEALAALLGKDAPNLSSAVIARLKGEWEDEYRQWQKRDLSARQYVYVWADGVYLQARMEPQAECMLVLMGATPEGKKELIGFQTGMRESGQSWKELLVDLKARG